MPVTRLNDVQDLSNELLIRTFAEACEVDAMLRSTHNRDMHIVILKNRDKYQTELLRRLNDTI